MDFGCDESLPVFVDKLRRPIILANTEDLYIDSLQRILKHESSFPPISNYMQGAQSHLEPWMREKVVQWMFEVGEHFSLDNETTANAIMSVDRILSIVPISIHGLQLLAVVCVLISCKLYERKPPKVEKIAELTDNTYTEQQVREMELFVLKHLQWRVRSVTALRVVQELWHAFPCLKFPQLHRHALFFVDLAVCDYQIILERPSVIAYAASLCAFQQVHVHPHNWSISLQTLVNFDMAAVNRVHKRIMISFGDVLVRLHNDTTTSTPNNNRALLNGALRRNTQRSTVPSSGDGQDSNNEQEQRLNAITPVDDNDTIMSD